MTARAPLRPFARWLLLLIGLGLICLVIALGVREDGGSLNARSSILSPRRALSAAILDGRVYAVGGWNGQTTQLNTVETLDPASGQWQAAPPLTIARSQQALVAAAGRLWVLGGWGADTGLVSAVEVWRPGQQAWTVVTHLPTPRREPAAAVLGSWIVVAGGFNGSRDGDLDGYSDVVEAYDLNTGHWQTLAPLLTPRRGLALVAVDNHLYALDGFAGGDGYLNVAERYDPETNRWQALSWPLTARTWAAATVLNGEIVVIGGYNRDGFLGLVERINPGTGLVCHPPALRHARAWLAAVPFASGILSLGGEEAQGVSGAVEMVEPQCKGPNDEHAFRLP